MNRAQLKEYLDAKVEQYNVPDFIPHDPIQIPHLFT
ncbi:MAG: TIGR02757 family protein, partial [Nonlabens ulvanivorans]